MIKILKNKQPTIIFYGSKGIFSQDLEEISHWAKKHAFYAEIDIEQYADSNKSYYQILKNVLCQLAKDEVMAKIENEWQKVAEISNSLVLQYKSNFNINEESKAIIWTENFAKNGTENFVEILSKQSQEQFIIVVFKNYEFASNAFQKGFERFLVPQTSKLGKVKFVLSYEGSFTPTWKTYNFEKFVYPISRVDKKLLKLKNPYIAGRPIRSKNANVFFGRNKLMDSVVDNLIKTNLASPLVIIGERRIGKTSLLLNLHKYISSSYIPVFIDLQSFDKPVKKKNSQSKLLWQIAYEISYELELQPPMQSDFENSPNHFFKNDFLRKTVFPELETKKLLLLFDEFEILDRWVTEDVLDIESLVFFRNLLLHSEKIVFIFSGATHMKHLTCDYWAELFNSSKYFEIGFLDDYAARELIVEPVKEILKYSETTVNKIIQYSGNHPYFIQLICSEVVMRAKNLCRRNVSKEDVDNAIDNAVSRGEGQLNYIWKSLSKDEQIYLRQIVHSNTKVVKNELLEGLIQKNVLLFETDNIGFRIGLLKKWIKQNTIPFKNTKKTLDLNSIETITNLINSGENSNVEFKSTLQWDIEKKHVSKKIRHSIMKTIVAFLNTKGGTLFIGVNDNGEIYGLEDDLKTVRVKGSLDHFQQLLVRLISDYIGTDYIQFIKIIFKKINEKYICILNVNKTDEPAFLKEGNYENFYVRAGNTTRRLDAKEITHYLKSKWR